MAQILRGDVLWAELNPTIGSEQAGLRPVVVLSHEVFDERSGTVIAVAVTSQAPRAGFPSVNMFSVRAWDSAASAPAQRHLSSR